ncbi:RNA polymerase sigma factor [Streptomyces cavernicola]|uniref:Sigma-70 family RNA polymerase sigma factor n=1 Tax=Streptomyces cavernicola TaxID=3043613 RepID=A0ABT6SK89_9ACTN|nr:sigma-70 family RNA polymerase sigma factor [Streptomyces sp. B-S-A6]MDI3408360.1 sigma-70 family RNA polymerase sigma factor [Streptomyces sp. B-S-A6]
MPDHDITSSRAEFRLGNVGVGQVLFGKHDRSVPQSAASASSRRDAPQREFAQFYEQHMPKLIRHLMRQGASGHEAAEAAQAAFTEAFVKWDTIEHPAAWLRQVAWRSHLRRRTDREDPVQDVPELPGGMCPLHHVELKEEETRVYAALAGLPPQQRRVLAWYLDGFAATEIAAVLGLSTEAVRQNLSRGRARLKTILLGPNDGGGR